MSINQDIINYLEKNRENFIKNENFDPLLSSSIHDLIVLHNDEYYANNRMLLQPKIMKMTNTMTYNFMYRSMLLDFIERNGLMEDFVGSLMNSIKINKKNYLINENNLFNDKIGFLFGVVPTHAFLFAIQRNLNTKDTTENHTLLSTQLTLDTFIRINKNIFNNEYNKRLVNISPEGTHYTMKSKWLRNSMSVCKTFNMLYLNDDLEFDNDFYYNIHKLNRVGHYSQTSTLPNMTAYCQSVLLKSIGLSENSNVNAVDMIEKILEHKGIKKAIESYFKAYEKRFELMEDPQKQLTLKNEYNRDVNIRTEDYLTNNVYTFDEFVDKKLNNRAGYLNPDRDMKYRKNAEDIRGILTYKVGRDVYEIYLNSPSKEHLLEERKEELLNQEKARKYLEKHLKKSKLKLFGKIVLATGIIIGIDHFLLNNKIKNSLVSSIDQVSENINPIVSNFNTKEIFYKDIDMNKLNEFKSIISTSINNDIDTDLKNIS